jgi:hypothetical protein
MLLLCRIGTFRLVCQFRGEMPAKPKSFVSGKAVSFSRRRISVSAGHRVSRLIFAVPISDQNSFSLT